MAGPTAMVLLQAAPTGRQLKQIQHALDLISSVQDENKIWINSTVPIGDTVATDQHARPFLFSHTETGNEDSEYGEEELTEIEHHVGFLPKHEIGLAAMCNDEEDHRVLGELALYFAELFDGVVDLDGLLNPGELVPIEHGKTDWRDIEPELEEWLSDYEGEIHAVTYGTVDSRIWAYHICDATFMRSWLASEHFRMIK